jgi:hypothetical protein
LLLAPLLSDSVTPIINHFIIIIIININNIASSLGLFPSRPSFLFFRTPTRYLAINMTKVPPQPQIS